MSAPFLAFDDGPLETTGPILDILAEHGVKAAFFVVGERIEGNEELLRRMRDEGHEIGNHTWSHQRLTELDDVEIADEIARCQAEISRSTGDVAVTSLRPPFAVADERVLGVIRSSSLRVHAQSSVGDYDLEADEIVPVALGAARSGFVGLHDGHWPTVEALPRILAGLAEMEPTAA